MGLIIGVICATIVMAVRLGPTTANRSDVAAKESLLTNKLSDDIANGGTGATGVSASTPATTQPCSGSPTPLATINRADGTQAVYTVALTAVPGVIPATNKVVIARKVGAITERGLTGYCLATALTTFVTAYSAGTGTYTFDVMLSPAVGDPPQHIRFGGARRVS